MLIRAALGLAGGALAGFLYAMAMRSMKTG